MKNNVFFYGAKSKLFPQYRESSLQGFFAFKLRVSSTGQKSLQGFFRSNSKSSLQGLQEIPIGIFSFKLKVIPIGICWLTQSLQYRGKSVQGCFRSNTKSPIQRGNPYRVVSLKFKVSSGVENLYRDCSLKRSIQYRWKSLQGYFSYFRSNSKLFLQGLWKKSISPVPVLFRSAR